MSSAAAAGAGSASVYTKPGQKFPTPAPGAGERVFYESLLEEKPKSFMALTWAVEHGLAFEGAETNVSGAHPRERYDRSPSF